MKWVGILIVFLVFLSSCGVLQNNGVVYRLHKNVPDTAFVYSLPFAKGTSHPVWQGYHSLFSHWGNYAVDFKMKPGTVIHAARSGVVAEIRDSFKAGGVGMRYVGKENAVIIRHHDNTYAHYLHVQHKGVLVKRGDRVQQGQPIALSGHTGFSAFPHLHFEVTESPRKAGREIPVRFRTENGIQFLQPLRRYKAQ
jgi:murein DD-endopeptidase MepM/ murein hydrolase activator NlpD